MSMLECEALLVLKYVQTHSSHMLCVMWKYHIRVSVEQWFVEDCRWFGCRCRRWLEHSQAGHMQSVSFRILIVGLAPGRELHVKSQRCSYQSSDVSLSIPISCNNNTHCMERVTFSHFSDVSWVGVPFVGVFPRDQLPRNQLPQAQLPQDQLPMRSIPTRSTSHEINSYQTNFPRDQLNAIFLIYTL